MNALKKRLKRSWWLWMLGKVLPWAAVVALLTVCYPTPVIGVSMEPTIHTGDILLVSRLKEPQVGDIVVAQIPERPWPLLCKRVADIQEGQYYLLGDNTDNSFDSRWFGTIGRDSIIGTEIYSLKIGGFIQCAKSFLFF